MGAELTSASPLFPYVIALFVLSACGIVFTLVSKDVKRKQWIFPATLVLFSAMGFLILYEGRHLAGNTMAILTIVGLLAANAVWARSMIRYCDQCGATFQSFDRTRHACAGCERPNA